MQNRLKLLLPILLLMLCAQSAFAACTSPCVQVKHAGNGAAQATLEFTFDSSQTSGNANIISLTFCKDGGCTTAADTSTITVADTGMNTYTSVVDNTGNVNIRLATFIATGIASGSNTVTITISGGSGSPNFIAAVASEWVPFASSPFDASGVANNTNADATVTTSGSTSQANEMVYGVIMKFGATPTTGSGYSVLSVDTTALVLQDQWKEVSSAAAQTSTWTHDATIWSANVATFKQTGGGVTCRGGLLLLGAGGC